jgi:hypothetical protein
MKRAALSPVASRHRARTTLRPRTATPPAPTGSARPKASLRTLATARATRHAYFNALCALVSPPQ